MYYSYDPEDGITYHDTAEQAKASAEKHLSSAIDYAADSGFQDNEGDISWGRVQGRVVLNQREPTDYEKSQYTGHDELVIYDPKLENVE
jgi:hypothetical protein